MTKLHFKIITPGFSLRRADTEYGDFRVWYSEDTWWYELNNGDSHFIMDGSEETVDDAMESCQKYYDYLKNKEASNATD